MNERFQETGRLEAPSLASIITTLLDELQELRAKVKRLEDEHEALVPHGDGPHRD